MARATIASLQAQLAAKDAALLSLQEQLKLKDKEIAQLKSTTGNNYVDIRSRFYSVVERAKKAYGSSNVPNQSIRHGTIAIVVDGKMGWYDASAVDKQLKALGW